jgi:hypothetical protein
MFSTRASTSCSLHVSDLESLAKQREMMVQTGKFHDAQENAEIDVIQEVEEEQEQEQDASEVVSRASSGASATIAASTPVQRQISSTPVRVGSPTSRPITPDSPVRPPSALKSKSSRPSSSHSVKKATFDLSPDDRNGSAVSPYSPLSKQQHGSPSAGVDSLRGRPVSPLDEQNRNRRRSR